MEDSDLLKALQQKTEPDCRVLRSLVRNYANLNIFILNKALSLSMDNEFFNSMRILIEAGASPNTKSRLSEKTPLHMFSATKHHTEMVRELLKRGADVNEEDSFKSTPLHEASFHQCEENMQELLKNGASVDAVDAHGETPLFHAIRIFPKVSAVRVLLSAGADVNHRDEGGWTPLHHAVANEYASSEVLRSFLRHNDGSNVIDIAGGILSLHRFACCTQKPIGLISELHKAGGRLNELNNGGHSPLYCAINFLNGEATQELLRCGAPVDVVKCLKALVLDSAVLRPGPFHEITIARDVIRYVFINNPGSLESIRQQLMQKKVVRVLCKLSSRKCNLDNFKFACLSEVEVLSKSKCDCGKSSIWGSINNCEECLCDTHQAILKFLFSGWKTNFTEVFLHRLSKEFLLEVTLNLITYFVFKESKKRLILPWPCRKGIERYVSFEDAVSYLKSKQSEMSASESKKFLAFM